MDSPVAVEMGHIAVSMVARETGGDPRKLKVAVFTSGADAITAALGGHVDLLVTPAASVLPQIDYRENVHGRVVESEGMEKNARTRARHQRIPAQRAYA